MSLYDYIYVDLNKVISLYSQMTGGVVEILERSSEQSRSSDNKRNYDFKIFKHDAGGTVIGKESSTETVKPHHALLKELETTLAHQGHLADLTRPGVDRSFRDSAFRAILKDTFCIKVRGRALIEDYARMKSIGTAFPEVVKLINKSHEASLLSSPGYLDLKNRIESAEKDLRSTKDRNARSNGELRLKTMRQELAATIKESNKVGMVEQWILDGMKTWIDTFLPGIVNLRIYPSTDRPDEHVFGHLKKDCFEDSDPASLHFTYGSFPTEELTMLGIITSVPAKEGEQFKPLTEFDRDNLADYESVEHAFRGLFRGFDGLEQMIRTCRFPRILVYPLTVYRSVSPAQTTT